jgi:hypothetical protein
VYLTCQALGAAYGHSAVDSLFDSLRFEKQFPNSGRQLPALNSVGILMTHSNRVATHQESPALFGMRTISSTTSFSCWREGRVPFLHETKAHLCP